ncbi:Ferroportin (FP) Family, partial [Phytophthora palmivora]
MEATVLVCLVMGLVSALFALDSGACVGGFDAVCMMSAPANMVTLILSTVTLVPVSACLITVWLDARDGVDGEHQSLLSGEGDATSKRPRRVITYLYAGHLLSAWGDRMWGFAVPILFMDIF